MKFLVCPELPTGSSGSSQATTDTVDNSAPSVNRPQSTYKSGNAVQTNGATSVLKKINAKKYADSERVNDFASPLNIYLLSRM